MTRFDDERKVAELPATVEDWSRRGVRRTTLTGPRYERTAYGFYRPALSTITTGQRIVDVTAGLPAGAMIAGWAAAYVHGVEVLDGLDDFTMKPLPVPVLLAPRQCRRSTEAVIYRQSVQRVRREAVSGVPVTSMLRTALDLALLAPDLTEAVVVLDAVLASRRLTIDRLQRAGSNPPARRGACQARRAIELSRLGVASTWESRLRMFAELELGWTDLQPNRAVST